MRICIRLVIAVLAFAPAARASDTSVWKIEYRIYTPMPLVLYLGKNTFKIATGNYTVLSEGPKWDAYVFKTISKECLFLKYANWKKYGLGSIPKDFPPLNLYEKVPNEENIIGLPTTHWLRKGTHQDGIWRQQDKPMACIFHYYGTDAIPISETQRELFCSWFGTPLSKDLPLIWARAYGGKTNFTLKAKGSTKIPYTASLFARPANYKTVQDINKFFIGNQNLPTIESLVDINTSGHDHK